jgi:hypothetical protein
VKAPRGAGHIEVGWSISTAREGRDLVRRAQLQSGSRTDSGRGPARGPSSMPPARKTICGVCREEASRTVLVTVAGLTFLKDLCPSHLSALLAGTRETH